VGSIDALDIADLRYKRKSAIFAEMPAGESKANLLELLRARLARAEDNGWFFARIAEQVVARRKELELSQTELAQLCGTTQSAIARLEAGGRPPRIDTLLRLAVALDSELVVELRPAGSSSNVPTLVTPHS
jgi:DNA-binding XRE family transcriptional regulator